jgi:hypothetical protein
MQNLFILLDYKDRFESKFTAIPYRSGFDKELLKRYFNDYGYEVNYFSFHEIDFRNFQYSREIFLFCSSEDRDGFYKSYIEDIVLGLKLSGAILIPDYIYLKAQNNKLFMEILRDIYGHESMKNIRTRYFGTLEDLIKQKNLLSTGGFVIKPSMGAMSEGVSSASDFNNIIRNTKKISRTRFFRDEVKDLIRRLRHKGYLPDSKFQRKFIVQEMIMNLAGDWKILIYAEKYYVLKRKNRKNDFRASGSGLLSYERHLPSGLLDFASLVYSSFKTPNLSIDVGFDKKTYFLIEFQSLYFGSYTMEHSDFYFIHEPNGWKMIEENSILEQEYARSISLYIQRNLKI